MDSDTCLVCGGIETGNLITVKDNHLGSNEEFVYAFCKSCESLQRITNVEDLGKYYPQQYYSLNDTLQSRSFLKKLRNKYELTGRGFVGKLISKSKPYRTLNIIRQTGVVSSSKILDVGSGSGEILQIMNEAGFTNLMGLDPFISETIISNGITIQKKNLEELHDKDFDLVMFHHSLEHTANPKKILLNANKLLAVGGACLVRIPKFPSYGWNKYKEYWLHIDAPRHFFIPSVKGMKALAQQAGFSIKAIVDDMTPTGIWGSEQYLKGVSLISEMSYQYDRSKFTDAEMHRFSQIASEANRENRGDTAAFILEKI